MIRLHNDTIVDLSGAAAQYAVTIANQILADGNALSQQITEWSELDNEAITVFNNIYDEVKDDKDAVNVLVGEVRQATQDILGYKQDAQTAATNASASADQANSYKNDALGYKNDTLAIKNQADFALEQAEQVYESAMNDVQSYVDSAEQSAISAGESAEIANQKEGIVSDILTSHANIIEITDDEIDDIWDEDYTPEDESDEVDGDGIYDLPIPIPKIRDMFGGD